MAQRKGLVVFMDLQGKKILFLGGAFQHCKAVETAKQMGLTVYVTDYLNIEDAPAKQMADHWWMHNIYDIDDIVEACKREQIDGVLQICLDPCQKPYQQVCRRLGKPCYGTEEQFRILTDKTAFKRFCMEHNVDVIPEYTEEEFRCDGADGSVAYPVLVKPSDSRSSLGQSVCHTRQEVLAAIEVAKAESATGRILIEKYMGGHDDFTMAYFVVNGVPYMFRMTDRMLGSAETGMDRVAVASIGPSKHTQIYMDNVHGRVADMIRALGIQNGPMFLQGFVDGDTVRFYDPGFRFPGAEFERVYAAVHNLNLIEPLIEYAVTGSISSRYLEAEYPHDLAGKHLLIMLPPLRPGKIHKILGVQEMREHPNVLSAFLNHKEGDVILPTQSIKQLAAEIDIVCDDVSALKQTAQWIYEVFRVEDEHGENMLSCPEEELMDWIDSMLGDDR